MSYPGASYDYGVQQSQCGGNGEHPPSNYEFEGPALANYGENTGYPMYSDYQMLDQQIYAHGPNVHTDAPSMYELENPYTDQQYYEPVTVGPPM
ncbi:unnamed protein product [Schistosoma turkestanicum]|nr:unnamed protein product [Schistosoma turkestanicum]